jgi:hypothetical protein
LHQSLNILRFHCDKGNVGSDIPIFCSLLLLYYEQSPPHSKIRQLRRTEYAEIWLIPLPHNEYGTWNRCWNGFHSSWCAVGCSGPSLSNSYSEPPPSNSSQISACVSVFGSSLSLLSFVVCPEWKKKLFTLEYLYFWLRYLLFSSPFPLPAAAFPTYWNCKILSFTLQVAMNTVAIRPLVCR